MWPWEHAVLGYLALSLFSRLWYREPPGTLATLVVVFASVLPDLVDKPLAWQFGLVPSGYAVAHSVFVATTLAVFAVALGILSDEIRLGVAFALGYLLHLVGDVIPIYAEHGVVYVDHLLWPVVTVRESSPDVGFTDQVLRYFLRYLSDLSGSDPGPYVLFQFGLAAVAFLLWFYDGRPGIPKRASSEK